MLKIFFRVSFKFVGATAAAKVVRLPLELSAVFGRDWIHRHAAHRIFDDGCGLRKLFRHSSVL